MYLENSKLTDLSFTNTLTAKDVLISVNDSLKRYGYTLMIIHPHNNPKSRQFPLDDFNIISVKKDFEKNIVRIFKQLGLKAENISTFPPLKGGPEGSPKS